LFYSSSPKILLIDDDLKTSRYERITNLPIIGTPTSPILQQIIYQVKVLNDVVISMQQQLQIFSLPSQKTQPSSFTNYTKTTSIL